MYSEAHHFSPENLKVKKP